MLQPFQFRGEAGRREEASLRVDVERDFLQLFSTEPLDNFFIRLQAERSAKTHFPLLPSAGLVGFGPWCL